MAGTILRRLLALIPVLLVVSIAVFALIRAIPGNPIDVLYGAEGIDRESRAALVHKLGLDQPVPVQYVRWLGRMLVGDWGYSAMSGQPVRPLVLGRLPTTYFLAFCSMVIALVISLPLGCLAALRRNKLADLVATIVALLALSIPNIVFALLLIFFFALRLRWLPSFGYVSPTDSLWQALRHIFMPAFALGTAQTGTFTRMVRSSLLEVLGEDYVRTARAKGLSELMVLVRHAAKNALIPVVTVVGMWIGFSLSGSLVVETIFGLPGAGKLFVTAILERDYPIVQATVMVIATTFMLVNLITDMVCAYLDPRIRVS